MTKDQRKGVTLEEAVQEYADPRRLEESDHYGGYDREWRSRPPSYVFFTEGPLPSEANAADRRERLWADMEEDLWRLLENGELALWGYWRPLERTSRLERAEPHLIPLLKPNFENSTAEGGGLSLENARVYPVGVVPEDAETGDEALHESASGSQSITNAISENEAIDLSTGQTVDDAGYPNVHQKMKDHEASARHWLQKLVEEYPERQPRSKDDLREEAKQKFRVTGKGFDHRVWERVLPPKHPWRDPGPLPKK